MSDNAQVQSGDAAVEQVAQSAEQPQKEYSLEHLTKKLKEVNEEAKTYRLKLQEEKRKSEETERKRLEAEGNYKQLFETERAEKDQFKDYATKLKSAFATKTIFDQVALQAKDLGCVDVEVINNLIDVNGINVDYNFRIDAATLKTTLEEIRVKKPYLFQKPTPKISDVNPSVNKIEMNTKKLNDMSAKEIEKLLLEKFKK